MDFSVNFIAVIVAAIAGAMANAAWYSGLLRGPVAALRKADPTIAGRDPMPPLYGVALLAQLVMAFVIAVFFRSLGGGGIAEGITIGAMGWLGFAITALSVVHSFGYRKPLFILIDGTNWLIGALLMGAIIGAFG